MIRNVLLIALGILFSASATAKNFYMITQSVTKNHLKFKQTSNNTWLMWVPATYPCPNAGGNAYTGFKFIVSDDEGYLYMPATQGSTEVNGEDLYKTGTLQKASSKRETWWGWWSNSSYLEVKKDVPEAERKNPYNGMTAKDLVMDGCLQFTIKLQPDGNLTYHAALDRTRRVAYAASNCTEGSDNGTYFEAKHTTFLFANRQADGTFSPYYQGKIVFENIPSENNNNIKHNGFYFYTPIGENGEPNGWDKAERWWKQVGNSLGTRGISPDGEDLFQNGGNYEAKFTGSYNLSTTFYYGKYNQGRTEKMEYDHPLVGSIRTYCNETQNMMNRYNVRSFIVTGYMENNDEDKVAFELKEIPYIPAKVGVVLYTEDANVDTLAPKKEWTGQTSDNIERDYDKNYLVPTFEDTPVSTYSYDNGKKYINFFLSKLFTTVDYKNNEGGRYTGKEDFWGFFSVLGTSTSHANRAYLQYPSENVKELTHWVEASTGAKGARLFFEDNSSTTGIKKIEDNKPNANDDAYYTLDGRKVEKPSHGIFVHNGKKYLFK